MYWTQIWYWNMSAICDCRLPASPRRKPKTPPAPQIPALTRANADTAARVIPYYQLAIEPLLKQGQNILVVAHGNSLRSLAMFLEQIGEEAIADFDLPTGIPRQYSLDANLRLEQVTYL